MGRFKRRQINEQDRQRQPACLADLARAGIGVFCWCNRCGHNAEAATAMLVAQLGPHFPVPEVGGRMRCSACGSEGCGDASSLAQPGQIARHSS